VEKAGLDGKVEVIRAAVADTSGCRNLAVNPFDPADHRLGTTGLPVDVFSVDDMLARRGWPAVSLIKADVQGAEFLVFSGARETVRRFRPAWYLEIDDEALASFRAGAQALLSALRETGYKPYYLGPKGITGPLSLEEALQRQKASRYIDLLFLYTIT
ncbi:MAG: FkbM family methyltransferase, partial [Endomicrobiales bacterium]